MKSQKSIRLVLSMSLYFPLSGFFQVTKKRSDAINFLKAEQGKFHDDCVEFNSKVRQKEEDLKPAHCQIYHAILRNISFIDAYNLKESEFRTLLLKHKKNLLERKKSYQESIQAITDDENELQGVHGFHSRGLSTFTDLWVQSINLSAKTVAISAKMTDITLGSFPLDAILNVGTSGLGLALTLKSSVDFFKKRSAKNKLLTKIKTYKDKQNKLEELSRSSFLRKEDPLKLQALKDEKENVTIDLKILQDSLLVKKEYLQKAAHSLTLEGFLTSSTYATSVMILTGATGIAASLAGSIVGGLSYGIVLAYVSSTHIRSNVSELKELNITLQTILGKYTDKKNALKGKEATEVEILEEIAYQLKISILKNFHRTIRSLMIARSSVGLVLAVSIVTTGSLGVAASLGVVGLGAALHSMGFGIVGLVTTSFSLLSASYGIEHYWSKQICSYWQHKINPKKVSDFSVWQYNKMRKKLSANEVEYKKIIKKFQIDIINFAAMVSANEDLEKISAKLEDIYSVISRVNLVQREMNKASIETVPYRVYFQMSKKERPLVKLLFRRINSMSIEDCDILLKKLEMSDALVKENPYDLSKKELVKYMLGIWILTQKIHPSVTF